MSLFHMNFVLPTMQQSDITKSLAMHALTIQGQSQAGITCTTNCQLNPM